MEYINYDDTIKTTSGRKQEIVEHLFEIIDGAYGACDKCGNAYEECEC